MDRTHVIFNFAGVRHHSMTSDSPDAWLSQVVSLEAMLFPKAYGRASLKRDLHQGNVWVDVLLEEATSQVVAYGISQKHVDEIHIVQLGTHPQQQRKGYARFLLQLMIQRAQSQACERMVLEVRVTQVPALALYESLGFVIRATRRHYYTDNGEDAYLMTKELHAKTDER